MQPARHVAVISDTIELVVGSSGFLMARRDE